MRFGVPITEYDSINYGLAFERTNIGLLPNSPIRYIEYVNQFGSETDSFPATIGWASDKRDSVIYTTSGTLQRITAEIGLPIGDLTYYRTNYQVQWYHPLSKTLVFYTSGQIGYAGGYQNKPLPFYKVFYLGGVNSLRGYETASVGPTDASGQALGGSHLLLGSAEILFPFPGLQKDKSVRLGLVCGCRHGRRAIRNAGNALFDRPRIQLVFAGRAAETEFCQGDKPTA